MIIDTFTVAGIVAIALMVGVLFVLVRNKRDDQGC